MMIFEVQIFVMVCIPLNVDFRSKRDKGGLRTTVRPGILWLNGTFRGSGDSVSKKGFVTSLVEDQLGLRSPSLLPVSVF